MLQFDEYKVKLNNLLPQLDDLEQALNLDEAARQVDFLEAQCAADGFWDNPENSQKVLQKLKQEKNKLESQAKRRSSWDDMMVLCEMGNEEEDESLLPELEEEYATLIQSMESARLQTLLTGEYDASNAILAFHAGAGGTEAQDWAQMLYRMYTRWAERHGFTYKIMDYQEGDEAGLKSATIMIEGENAYGYLRGEHGVHRLVRVSPFDANARRQTSFASVEVMPDLPEDAGHRDPAGGHRDAGLPRQRRRRPARQQDLLRRATHPPAHRRGRLLPDRAKPVPEQRQLHEDAPRQASRAANAGKGRENF